MKKKLVIYTAIIGGGYDNLHQPLAIREGVDFVCYVKKGMANNSKNGAWEIREIDFENKDNTRVARYVKMHPHELFPEYEYCLWIDGNIQISGNEVYDIIEKKIRNGVLVSSMQHPHVDCSYDDAYICMAMHKDKAWRILTQMAYLKIHGFPKGYGMYETNVFLRNNQSEVVERFNKQWWKILSHMSRRDQLGCMYSMWKLGIPTDYFMEDGKNARNCEYFNYFPHTNKKCPTKSRSIARKWIVGAIKKTVGYRKNYSE